MEALERILNLIILRAKVDIHPASNLFSGAVFYTSFTDIIILSKSSTWHWFSLVFFSWAVGLHPLAALHLLVLLRFIFGHGHAHKDTLAASYPRCITSGSLLSGDIHTSRTGGPVSISFFSSLNVSLPRLNTASSCFRNIALAFSYYLSPASGGFV